jgi:hypothetical protein
MKMVTKGVLHRTRRLGWGTDTHLYESAAELAQRFPPRVGESGVRVLKQGRGNGGNGVWKVTLLESDARLGYDAVVRVQHAQTKDAAGSRSGTPATCADRSVTKARSAGGTRLSRALPE